MLALSMPFIAQSTTLEEYEVQFKFGGWSKHKQESKSEYEFNESHNGFGLSLYNHMKKDKLFGTFDAYSYDTWYMRDSFDKEQYQLGMSAYKTWQIDIPAIEKVQFVLAGGVMKRSYGQINTDKGTLSSIESRTLPYILPGFSWYLTENFHADFAYIPKIKGINDFPTIFFRFGSTF